jgi:predicted Zn-dependent protease
MFTQRYQPRTPLILLLLIGLITFAGCTAVSDKSVIRQAQGFDEGIKAAEIKDPDVDAYFQRVGARIIAAARESDRAKWGPPTHFNSSEPEDWMFKGIQFHLVNSKTLNAFTTGGEHVYIYNELFQLCHGEEELAAVMSHEFGHIYSRHVQKGTTRQYGVMAAALGLGAVGYVAGGKDKGMDYGQKAAALGMVAGNFVGMRFTRSDEAQADECGFHFYCLSGWDPDHFGDFFKTMIDKGYDKGSELTSDHPSLASRLKIAQERARTTPDLPPRQQLRKPPTASPAEFRRYQEAAGRASKTTPDDTSLAKSQKLLAAIPRSCLTPVDPPDQQKAREELMQDLKKDAPPALAAPAAKPAAAKRSGAAAGDEIIGRPAR